jgi:hypothetical protein
MPSALAVAELWFCELQYITHGPEARVTMSFTTF